MESNAVVSKLQSAIANFRREKDAAQRNRDLAIERLKASTMTFESEQAKTASLQSRLDDINRKIAAGNGQEIAQKRGENDRLERETNFQHTELVRKREKLSALQAKMAEESARRAANIQCVRRSVKMWRERNSVQQTTMAATTMEGVAVVTGGRLGSEAETEEAAAATAAAVDKLRTILNDRQERGGEDADSYLGLLLSLPRLIDGKATLLAEDAADVERKIGELQFVAGRYRAETDVVATNTATACGGGGGGCGEHHQQPPLMVAKHPMQECVGAACM